MNAINVALSNVLACTAAWLIATRMPHDEHTVLTYKVLHLIMRMLHCSCEQPDTIQHQHHTKLYIMKPELPESA